jgi:hypothetical protein
MACERTQCEVRDYTVAPVYFSGSENGAHEWLIEFERAPSDLSYFSEVLDNSLKSLNSDYEAKRFKDMALRPPILHSLPKDTFISWLRSKGKLGGQHKIPRLSNNRQTVEEVLMLMKENKLTV